MDTSNAENTIQANHQLRPLHTLFNNRTATSVAGAMLMGSSLVTPQLNAEEATTEEAKKKLAETVVKADQGAKLKPEALSSPRYTAPLRDIPRTVTVVPAELIKQQNATTIQEALRNVPGISLQAGEGGVMPGDNLTLRGFSAQNSFFVDGVRDLGSSIRDPFNYEQIEVSKGPSSTDGGRDAAGGSINLASKTAKDETFTNAALTAGTDSFLRTTLDLNRPIEALEGAAFRLNLMGHTAYTPGRDYVQQQRWGIAPTISFGLGTDTVTTLSYLHMTSDNVPDYGIPWVNNEVPSGVSFDNWYGIKGHDFEDIQTDLFTAEVRHTYNESLSFRTLARFGRNERNSLITPPRLVDNNDPSAGVKGNHVVDHANIGTIASLVFDGQYQFNTGAAEHTLVAGADYTREKDRLTRTTYTEGVDPVDLYDPNANRTSNLTNPVEASSTGRVNTIGLFLYDTIKLNEQWLLNGGLRYDNMDTKYDDDTRFSRTDDIVSWRTSVAYKPQENGSIYLAYGTASEPSAGARLNLSAENEGLDPEKTNTVELGTKWDLADERIQFSAAVFHTEKTNAAVRQPDASYELAGEVTIQGLELGLTGEITDQWSIFAGYTFMDAEQDDLDDRPDRGEIAGNTPKHSFTIWSNYELNEKLDIAGGVRFVGDRDTGTNNRVADSYFVFDAAVTYQLREDLSLQFNLQNIADERYVGSLGGGHFIPGAGRSASVSINYSF